MNRIIGIVVGAMLATGCVSNFEIVTVKASPRAIADIAKRQYAGLTLTDGTVLEMRPPRDFGDAICGDPGCARKSEIASIEYVKETPDLGGNLLLWTVGVPAAAVMTGVLVATCNLGCPQEGDGTVELPPMATPEQLARVWLDKLTIRDGRYMGRETYTNPCTKAYGTLPAPDDATDEAALERIWTNRHHESASCLWEASEQFRKMQTDASRDRAMRLWSLHAVKRELDVAHCVPPAGARPRGLSPIAPSDRYDLDTRKGDPEFLRIIAETLADPMSYIDANLASRCSYGLRPDDEIQRLIEQVKTMGPFGRSVPATG